VARVGIAPTEWDLDSPRRAQARAPSGAPHPRVHPDVQCAPVTRTRSRPAAAILAITRALQRTFSSFDASRLDDEAEEDVGFATSHTTELPADSPRPGPDGGGGARLAPPKLVAAGASPGGRSLNLPQLQIVRSLSRLGSSFGSSFKRLGDEQEGLRHGVPRGARPLGGPGRLRARMQQPGAYGSRSRVDMDESQQLDADGAFAAIGDERL